jgi:uncharacterized protein (DUF58 family)
MSKETFIFIAGILLTIIPFLGVPLMWRQYVIFGIGVLLIFIGYVLRRKVFLERIDMGDGERGTDSFVETTEKLDFPNN